KELYCPATADAPNILAVGAAASAGGLLESLSSFGWHTIHLLAPGEAIVSIQPNGMSAASGTSVAVPQVSGAEASLRAIFSTEKWTDTRRRILGGGKPDGSKTITGRTLDGAGALNGQAN